MAENYTDVCRYIGSSHYSKRVNLCVALGIFNPSTVNRCHLRPASRRLTELTRTTFTGRLTISTILTLCGHPYTVPNTFCAFSRYYRFKYFSKTTSAWCAIRVGLTNSKFSFVLKTEDLLSSRRVAHCKTNHFISAQHRSSKKSYATTDTLNNC